LYKFFFVDHFVVIGFFFGCFFEEKIKNQKHEKTECEKDSAGGDFY